MWANYWSSNIEPTPAPIDDVTDDSSTTISTLSKITCTGKPQLKVGGSAKTFTVVYYSSEDGEIIEDYTPGIWQFSIDNETIPGDLIATTPSDNNRKVKIKFLGDDSYIGKILKVTNISDGDVVSSLEVEILPL